MKRRIPQKQLWGFGFGRFTRIAAPGPLPVGVALVLDYTSSAVLAFGGLADSNTNGLPDWRELQYFDSLNSGQACSSTPWVPLFQTARPSVQVQAMAV